jgi:hypothetical protein
MAMQVDLAGRVGNLSLPYQYGLRPVFEAVINASDAVAEKGKAGSTVIRVHRDQSQLPLQIEGALQPIQSFQIVDSGAGFNSKNWAAFQQCDTTSKAAKGGKGIGRLLFLKAFDHAAVESTFEEEGVWQTRSFVFSLPDGISEHKLVKAKDHSLRTSVRLIGYQDDYRSKSPKTAKAIASRLIEHCLSHFVLSSCPSEMRLIDGDEVLDLWELFETYIQTESSRASFEIGAHRFDLLHVLVDTSIDDKHRIHYCAQDRVVCSDALNIPDLPQFILKGDGKSRYYYAAYVSSPYLDRSVTPERTTFIGRNDPETLFTGDISWQELRNVVGDTCKAYLKTYTEPVRKEKTEAIRRFVENQAPQYRPLLKRRPEVIDKLSHDLQPRELDIELYKYDQEYRSELKENGDKILANLDSSVPNMEEFGKTVEAFLEQWNELGMAELAQYVAYRKAVLLFLEKSLCRNEDGSYDRESAIHQAILPLKCTSDEIASERMNLWVIDDRLMYHRYLASDVPYKKMSSVVDVPSADRPDIIIFHSACAFVEAGPPATAVSIVEFKRPARNEYTEKENPIGQLIDYARQLRSGKAVSGKGRPISGLENAPFYGYLVCDLTPKLRDMAETASLYRMPDNMGYFGYNPNVQMYIQVISFEKLIGDAKKRNAILFEKLNIPL